MLDEDARRHTSLFGSGASGGLGNISNNRIHEQPPETFSATLNASYNSVANAKILSISSDAAIKNVGFHVDVLTRMTDNYDARIGEILNSSVKVDDINAGASFIIFKRPCALTTILSCQVELLSQEFALIFKL